MRTMAMPAPITIPTIWEEEKKEEKSQSESKVLSVYYRAESNEAFP